MRGNIRRLGRRFFSRHRGFFLRHRDFLPLDRGFCLRDPVAVARDLLGIWLLRTIDGQPVGGPIVEAEAYLGEKDPGSHASRRHTRSNDAMWAPGGTAYVYTIHTHHCLNVVTGEKGRPQAVLLRALEPRLGLDIMRRLRGRDRPRDLCSGPGKLCQALDVGMALNYHDLTAGRELFLAAPEGDDDSWPVPEDRVAVTARVGLAPGKGHEMPLRFFLRDSRFVSRGPKAS